MTELFVKMYLNKVQFKITLFQSLAVDVLSYILLILHLKMTVFLFF